MREAILTGLVTGWAIAVPVGAIAAFLVTLTARTSWRVGAAGALGVATVDGGYALVAVAAGASVAAAVGPVARPLAVVSGLVLLGVALVLARGALRPPPEARGGRRGVRSPGSAYLLFLGLTAVNPATVVYFAAFVLGNPDLVETRAQGAAFVAAAFAASASWQLTLAGVGAGLGRAVVGERGHRITGLVSAAVVAALAVRTVVG